MPVSNVTIQKTTANNRYTANAVNNVKVFGICTKLHQVQNARHLQRKWPCITYMQQEAAIESQHLQWLSNCMICIKDIWYFISKSPSCFFLQIKNIILLCKSMASWVHSLYIFRLSTCLFPYYLQTQIDRPFSEKNFLHKTENVLICESSFLKWKFKSIPYI